MGKFDKLDRKLMYELDLNARQSYAQLAKKLRVSQEVVRYRLNRLIQNKVIDDFMTIIDIGKLGFYHYETYFRFQKLSEEKENELIEFMKNSNNILWLASCSGHYDMVFSSMAKDNIHFAEIISKISDKYGEYIAERNIQATIKIPHFSRSFLLPDTKTEELAFSSSSKKPETIDKTDFKILGLIMSKSRMPIIEIAEKLQISVDMVTYRLKNMKNRGIIQTYRPRYNKKNMGRLLYQVMFSFRSLNNSIKGLFIQYCKELGSIVYVLDTIGKYDLIIELEPETQIEFDDILKKIKNEFSDYIITYESISITKEHKMDYFRIDEKEFFENL